MARLAATARRGLSGISQREHTGTKVVAQASDNILDETARRDLVESVTSRYLANKRQIESVAREFGSRAIFVWQPIPFYKYDKSYHLFFKENTSLGENQYAKEGYERMEHIRGTEDLGRNFLWCADIQEQLKEPLYVDLVHYTSAMSNRLATYIVQLAAERALLVDQKNKIQPNPPSNHSVFTRLKK